MNHPTQRFSQKLSYTLLTLGVLTSALVFTTPAMSQIAQPSARGLEAYSSAGGDYLAKDLRKSVQALKGGAWDQRMARQFGQELEMPQAEVAKRLEILETWAREFARSGGPEVVAFETRLAAVKGGIESAVAGRGSLDDALLFIEVIAFELQTKEEAPETFGRVTQVGAKLTLTVGKAGISDTGHIVVVAPEGLRLQREDSEQEGFAALTLDGVALPAVDDFDLPAWAPEPLGLVWGVPAKLEAGRQVELTLALPPSAALGTALLVDLDGKGMLVGPGSGRAQP